MLGQRSDKYVLPPQFTCVIPASRSHDMGRRAEADLVMTCTGLFKAQVAAKIGRQPHEIMLKRQGERPFKDQLTLEDYGVSNGVQLDL